MSRRSHKRGVILVITAALLWGVGGAVAQRLFHEYAIDVNWLVTTRLLIAGLLLLAVQFIFKDRTQILAVWKQKTTAIQVILFSLFGALGMQYTYMASIEHGNAAVATLLQYLAPTLIILYLVMRKRSKLTSRDVTNIILALLGCFLLLTNGSLSTLSVSVPAIVWGLLSAVALAFNTVYPISLLAKYDSLVIVGWAMTLGGLVLCFIHPPWKIEFHQVPLTAWAYIFFVIILATMIAFWFYIESLQNLSPKETSLLSSIEPLAAVLTTVFWIGEPFGPYQWFGTACLSAMMILVATSGNSNSSENK